MRRVAAAARLGAAVSAGGAAAYSMPLSDWFAQPAPSLEAESLVSKFERDPEWVNCTTKLLSGAGMDVDSLDGSVIFDTLGARTNSIRLYHLYAKRDGTAVAGIASLGSGLDGHPGIVHGGVTALLFDNTFGWANAIGLLKERGALAAALHGPAKPALMRRGSNSPPAAEGPPGQQVSSTSQFGFTAFLHINYRAPVYAGTTVELLCALDRVEGRKRFLKGTMHDATGTLLADGDCLFVIPRGPG